MPLKKQADKVTLLRPPSRIICVFYILENWPCNAQRIREIRYPFTNEQHTLPSLGQTRAGCRVRISNKMALLRYHFKSVHI